MSKEIKPYILSLDIGTGSVGFSYLNENYRPLKYGQRDAIGSYIFNGAETAANTRTSRGMRRRYNRRKKRLALLQELFAPIIKNPSFISMFNNNTWKNDNSDFKNRSLSETLVELGIEPRKYPTIYHLQKELMETEEKFPLELIYLAIYHLVKYRGHFLFEQLDFNKSTAGLAIEGIRELLNAYEEMMEVEPSNIQNSTLDEINSILTNQMINRKDREKALKKLMPQNTEIPKMLLGLKFNQAKLFIGMENEEEIKEEKKESFSFDSEYEDKISEVLTDIQYEFIEKAENVYMSLVLEKIKGNHKSIAYAKVADYDIFKTQLAELKAYIKENHKNEYKNIFVSSKEAYENWLLKPQKSTLNELCLFDQYLKAHKKDNSLTRDKFTSQIRKLIEKSKGNYSKYEEQVLYLLEDDKLLLKQNTVLNSSLPMQNNLYEAERILKNQSKFYSTIDNDLIEKVKSIISFRIPYYVGPLVKQTKENKFGWMERTSSETIKPWNFDEVVDKSISAEKFIRKMTNKCTYLLNEEVIPKNSLLYQEMEVLNELNGTQLRLTTDARSRVYRLETEVKNWIIENVFKVHKNVTTKILLDKLKKGDFRYYTVNKNGELLSLFGTQKEDGFASKLSTYIDMKNIFGEVESNKAMIEEIVLWLTLFNEKSIIKSKIQLAYPQVTEEQIQKLLKLNYKGWGRVSEKILTERPVNESIIEMMRNRSITFMEAITDEAIKDFIASENDENRNHIKYKDIAALRSSPALKRGIWSAIKIVEELVQLFGQPKQILLEFAREEGEKGKRTKTRKESFYDTVKEFDLDKNEDFISVLEEIKDFDSNEFNRDSIWLYITQGGRCAYSRKQINLYELLNKNNEYQIDHIYPQHFVKDDSLDNKVLVLRDENQRKSGMPLYTVRPEVIKWWDKLHENKLMTSKKIARLKKPQFTDADKEGFIKRQLVETRQISVHVKDLLTEAYDGTEVIPMKADVVSKFRQHFNLKKVRALNDEHHAIDAYILACIYKASNDLYKRDFFKFDFKTENVKKKWEEITGKDWKNKPYFLFKDFEDKPLPSGEKIIDVVKDTLNIVNINVTKKTGNNEGAFYKQTAYSPKVIDAKYKSKKNELQVYSELKKSRAHIISYLEKDNKGSWIKRIEMVDELVIEGYQNDLSTNEKIAKFYEKQANGRVTDVKKHLTFEKGDLLIMKNHPVYFVSSNEVINAKQFTLEIEEINQLSDLMNKKKVREYTSEKALKLYSKIAEKYIQDYDFLLKSGKNKEKHIEFIRNYFKETNQTQESFIQCMTEFLKATSASSARFEKIGRRLGGLSKNSFLSKENNTKIIYQSITGLKQTRPKSIFKLVESGVEL